MRTMNLKALMEKAVESKPEDVDTVVEPVEELFDVDEDKAAKKLSDMSIDDNLSLIDSVRRGDKRGVADILDEDNPIGQEVSVNGDEGVVKIANGPGDTAGVMIDGELKMAKKNDIDALNETVLGMTNIPSLTRIMELAGIKTTDQAKADGEAEKAEGEAEVAAGEAEKAAAEQTQADTGIRPSTDTSGPEKAPAVATVQVSSAPVAEPSSNSGAIEMPSNLPEPAPEAPPALDTVRGALDQIEAVLPNLTVGEYREIRDRLTKLQNAIFEGVSARRKKSV